MRLLFPLAILIVVVGISTAFPDQSHPVEGDHLPDSKDKVPEDAKPQKERVPKTIIFAGGYPGMYGGYGYGGFPGYGYGYPGYGYYG